MKKTILILAIFNIFLNAQTEISLNQTFKEKLLEANLKNNIAKDINGKHIIIDTNNDNEIQKEEINLISQLDLELGNEYKNEKGDSSIEIDLTLFPNLTYFILKPRKIDDNSCSGKDKCVSNIKFINAKGLKKLKTLIVQSPVTRIDLTGCSNLIRLDINGMMTSLDLSNSGLINLETFNFGSFLQESYKIKTNGPLISINLNGLPKLLNLEISKQSIEEIDFKNLQTIENINLLGNKLKSIDVSGLLNLKTLNVLLNPLERIKAVGCINLYDMVFNDTPKYFDGNENRVKNTLQSIDLSGCRSMRSFPSEGNHIGYRVLSEFDKLEDVNLRDCHNLTELNISYSVIKNINIVNCKKLKSIYAFGISYFESLKLHGLKSLEELVIEYNDKLNVSDINGEGVNHIKKFRYNSDLLANKDIDLTNYKNLKTAMLPMDISIKPIKDLNIEKFIFYDGAHVDLERLEFFRFGSFDHF